MAFTNHVGLDEAWPRGRPALDRAEIGRQREDALGGIVVEGRAESASNFAIEKPHPTEMPMDWDRIALALAGVMFVTIFPGAIVEVHVSDDGSIEILPATHIPDEIFVDEVVRLRHPERSFEIQVLNNDSPATVTKLIFGPAA
jgi:hypothetical protein